MLVMFSRLFVARSSSVGRSVFLLCLQEFLRVSVMLFNWFVNANMANIPQQYGK